MVKVYLRNVLLLIPFDVITQRKIRSKVILNSPSTHEYAFRSYCHMGAMTMVNTLDCLEMCVEPRI